MPGLHITNQQEELYMQQRRKGLNQETAAAKAGISTRSGRRIEQSPITPRAKTERQWRTRHDPLEAVWDPFLSLIHI